MNKHLIRLTGLLTLVVVLGVPFLLAWNVYSAYSETRTYHVVLPEGGAELEDTSKVYDRGAIVGEVYSVQPLTKASPEVQDKALQRFSEYSEEMEEMLQSHPSFDRFAQLPDITNVNEPLNPARMSLVELRLLRMDLPVNRITHADENTFSFVGRGYLTLHTSRIPGESTSPEPEIQYIPSFDRNTWQDNVMWAALRVEAICNKLLSLEKAVRSEARWDDQSSDAGVDRGLMTFLQKADQNLDQHRETINEIEKILTEFESQLQAWDNTATSIDSKINEVQISFQEMGEEIRDVRSTSKQLYPSVRSLRTSVGQTLRDSLSTIEDLGRSLDDVSTGFTR